MTTTTENLFCPSCDVRAIGMEPREGERIAPVTVEAVTCGEEVVRCGGCGCVFNTGTTRQHGARMLPLTRHTLRWHIVTGRFCDGHESPARLVDVNYIEADGSERRVHGTRCDDCLGWRQIG